MAARIRQRIHTRRTVRGSGRSTAQADDQAVEKLSERVYQALKRDIVTAVLHPGEPLTESDLATRYRSSRTPVREAALRLEEQNLLRIVPNRGYFVGHLTVKDLNDIYEYRAAIECDSAEIASRRGIPASEMARLSQLGSYRGRSGSRASFEAFIVADTAFHIGIARLTQNSLLVKSIADMRCQMERVLYAAIDALEPNYYYGDLPVRGHQTILRAIKDGDADLARKTMYEHITSAKVEIFELVSSGSRLF